VHGLIEPCLRLHLTSYRDPQGDHHWRKLFAYLCREHVDDRAIVLSTDADLANAGQRLVEKAWLLLFVAEIADCHWTLPNRAISFATREERAIKALVEPDEQ
jgi:hypothetical protein